MQKCQYPEMWTTFALWSLMAVTMLALAGCAGQPPAQSNVQPIDARTLHVTTKATSWGDRSDVLKSLYSEIAKEAAQRGYAYFVIIDKKVMTMCIPCIRREEYSTIIPIIHG